MLADQFNAGFIIPGVYQGLMAGLPYRLIQGA
jgi:hypothetical protein